MRYRRQPDDETRTDDLCLARPLLSRRCDDIFRPHPPVVGLDDLPSHIQPEGRGGPRKLVFPVGTTLREIEQTAIRETLRHTGGDKRLAARLLGIATRTSYRRLDAGKLTEDGGSE